jgi:hypothetical protein
MFVRISGCLGVIRCGAQELSVDNLGQSKYWICVAGTLISNSHSKSEEHVSFPVRDWGNGIGQSRSSDCCCVLESLRVGVINAVKN